MPEPAGRGRYQPQTSNDRGRGLYIGAIHRITVVHTIYTIVYGLRFSVQISPGLLATGAFYFSLRLPRVFGLFLGLIYYCDDGEWRMSISAPPR